MVSFFAHFLFFTILLVFSFQPYSQHPLCRRDECLALLQFKESFVIDKHASFDDPFAYPKVNLWKSQGMDCCFWEGIWCDQDTGHVTGLDLSSSCLLGSINFNSSLFHLFHLEHLNLAFNNFNYSKIPSAFANLSSLSYLNLSNSLLAGQIPSELSRLTSLSTLDLAPNYNPFSPTKGWLELKRPNLRSLVENLTSLEYLRLTGTKINSKIPSTLANMSSLRYIRLGDCGLFGEFPMAIFQLPKLQVLTVTYNPGLTGNLPEFHFHNQLMILTVQNTSFSGKLPASIGMLSSLKVLNVSQCNFSGLLPSSLDLSHNKLNGMIPPCIGNFSKSLVSLNLQGNNFKGPIPPMWVTGNNLKMIQLGQNNLKGKLPRSLANCRMLEFLDLGNNHIRDTFPYWLGTLPRLKILILHFNKLYGAINVTESNSLFPSLHIVDLSHNEFVGLLPTKYFNAWSAMVDIDKENTKYWLTYDNCEISGYVFLNAYPYSMTIINKGLKMEYEKIIEIFSTIDLSCNKFEGEIPDVLGRLKGLQLLNLSNNILVGPIPPALGNLKNIETLDLSQNKLTGSIPTQLTQLNFLEVFNISHNHLTGPIPKGQQFDTFDNSSFDGNSGLCGLPLSRKCDNSKASPPPSSTSKGNEDSGLLAKFSWKTVALGYGCGFLVGVVIGNIVFATIREWLMRTYRIRLSRRKGKGSGRLNRIRMMQ
ncbi:hypothetical protein SLEP1_g7178 [Rubroshorea leprosula]|uniref:Disease resistance R13L4/SHOC-2-like LRR domain-containing protein n=1 Tax=Rubroshorea leprosula TaxID=152421 RepID=A0AAV5I7C4_9ROSI|nr:hypothetical protein SLEP1_g7178 [Rubroshorea leprosula]